MHSCHQWRYQNTDTLHRRNRLKITGRWMLTIAWTVIFARGWAATTVSALPSWITDAKATFALIREKQSQQTTPFKEQSLGHVSSELQEQSSPVYGAVQAQVPHSHSPWHNSKHRPTVPAATIDAWRCWAIAAKIWKTPSDFTNTLKWNDDRNKPRHIGSYHGPNFQNSYWVEASHREALCHTRMLNQRNRGRTKGNTGGGGAYNTFATFTSAINTRKARQRATCAVFISIATKAFTVLQHQ